MASILIVDDNRMILQALSDHLEGMGHDTEVACNGVDALELLKHHQPDLIIMDIVMPEMGGVEATRAIRQMPEVQSVPVIAFTSSFVFIILGISMLKKLFSIIKIAHFMTLLYIGFSIFNAIVIQMAPQNPFTVTATLFLTTAAVLLGVFLAVIIYKYKEMVAYDEIFI